MIKHVELSISDSWEIGETLGWPVFKGELYFEENSTRGVFYFYDPVIYQQKTYTIAIVSGRHGCLTSSEFDSRGQVPCSVICIPSDEVADPMEFVQTWRGQGLTFIGSITVAKKPLVQPQDWEPFKQLASLKLNLP